MFARLLGNNTPSYHGQGQTSTRKRGGLIGLVTSLLGGVGTPAYGGTAQPVPASSGGFSLFPQTPTYHHPSPAPAVAPTTAAEDPGVVGGDEARVEPQGKTITIVVRPGPGTTVEEVVQFLQDRVLDD
jgi:hypothetical protein